MAIDHWMMFGTFAEQKYFVYPSPETYRPGGTIITANMAAYAPAGLADFLLESAGGRLNYIIDPLTHAFQHRPNSVTDSEDKPKKSIYGLAQAYSDLCTKLVGKRPLLPRHFENESELRTLTKNCLNFQTTQLSQAMANTDVVKYVTTNANDLRPYAVIAPYFYMTETTYGDWLPINRRAIEIAAEYVNNARLFAEIVISQGVILNETISREILDTLKMDAVQGFILWVDNLDEQEGGTTRLRGFLEFARALRDGGKEVINLHGGYFSVLAAGKLGGGALSGVCHGPEFGEVRSVVPVGGGIPIARYYFPQLHARVRYRDTLRYVRGNDWLKSAAIFHTNVCNCDVCIETLAGDPANFVKFGIGNVKEVRRGDTFARIEYPTSETKQRCLKHYLQRKGIEYKFADTASEAQIRADLELGRDALVDVTGLDGVSHLNAWLNVLS